jgi:cytochrome P450 family 6
MSWSIFISLLISALTLIYFWIQKKFSYWKDRGFLFDKPNFPFGCLKDVGVKIHFSAVSKRIYEKFKNKAPAIGLYFFTSPVLYVMDLEIVKQILVKDFNNFVDRGIYFDGENDPLTGEWEKILKNFGKFF